MYSVHKYKTAVRNTAVPDCRKNLFFQKKCLFSIPIRTLCGLCVLQSLWAFYLGILAETPNPFPVVKGCVCLVGFASYKALRHTRPTSVPGLYCWGYRPWSLSGLCPCDPIFDKQEVYRQTKTAVRNTAVHSLSDCF